MNTSNYVGNISDNSHQNSDEFPSEKVENSFSICTRLLLKWLEKITNDSYKSWEKRDRGQYTGYI